MKGYELFLKALCLWLSALTFAGPQAFAHTNDTDYGRAQVTWPDLGHEGGTTLQTKITDGIKKISDNLTGRWAELTLANLGSTNVVHNFGLATTKLKVLVFESGNQLTAAQKAANYVFSEVDTNTFSVQNVSGSSKTFQVIVLAYKGGIEAADFDAAVSLDTTGTVRASELRTLSNGDVVVNHNASESAADWKATIHRPTSGMSANAVYTLPLSTATFATTSLSESFTNKNLKSSTNLLTGAKADSLLTETGSNTVTFPAAGGTLSTLAGSETITNKNLQSATNNITGATATSLTNGGTVTLPSGNVTVVARNTTDTLTNKTIQSSSFDGGTASSTQFITLPGATLSTLQGLSRTAGKLYYATDTTLVYYDNGSVLSPVGSGSGSGSKNYIVNDGVETDLTGYATYADAAATTPVDGTGGSATTLTATRTTTGAEILDGTASYKLVKSAANGQGQGFSYDFTIDNGYTAAPQSLYALINTNSANYVAGDIVACVYDVTASSFVVLSGATVGNCVPVPKADKQQFRVSFNPNVSTSTSYRLIFHVSTTNATTYTAFFDKLTVTPIVLPVGPVMGDWVEAGATVITGNGTSPTKGTVKVDKVTYRRVGDSAEIRMNYLQQGAGSAGTSTIYYFAIPSVIGVADMNYHYGPGTPVITDYDDETSHIGTCSVRDGSLSPIRQVGKAYLVSSSLIGCDLQSTNLGNAAGALSTARIAIGFEIKIKVASWAGSANIVNGPNIEYACNSSVTDANDTSSFSNDPNGCAFPNVSGGTRNKQIRFLYAAQPGDKHILEVTIGGPDQWKPAASTMFGVLSNTTGFSIADKVSATDFNIVFAPNGTATAPGYGTEAWSTWSSSPTNFRWRVRKESGVAATAYAAATATSDGFVSPSTQTFGGLKTFAGGESSVEYVGTNPEPGGSSPFQLTAAHKRVQNISPTGTTIVRLPTTDILAGETVEIISRTTAFGTTIQASNGSEITKANGSNMTPGGFADGRIKLQALQDTPTTPAHWRVLDFYRNYEDLALGVSGLGLGSGATATLRATRSNNIVTAMFVATTGSGPTATNFSFTGIVPTSFRPVVNAAVPALLYDSGGDFFYQCTFATNGNVTVTNGTISTGYSSGTTLSAGTPYSCTQSYLVE